MGRPTDCPKNTLVQIRMDDETVQQLHYCSKEQGVSRAEVVRQGIKRIYADIKK